MYCYRCTVCGHGIEQATRTAPFRCPECGGPVSMKRDYRAEDVGIGSGVRESRVPPDTQALHKWAEKASEAEGL